MLSRFEGDNMNLLQMLTSSPNSVEIKNSIYIDNRTSLFGLSKKQTIIPLHNGIISGVMNEGRNSIIDLLLYDAVNSNNPVFFLRNRVNGQSSCRFACDIEQGLMGSRSIVLDINKGIGAINLLKGISLESVKDLITNALRIYGYDSKEMESFIYKWLGYIFKALKKSIPKERFALARLNQYDEDWLLDKYQSALKNNRIDLTEYNKDTKKIKDISKKYSVQLDDFITFSERIINSNLASMLSGSTSISDIYNNNMTILVNLSEGKQKKESAALLELLVERLSAEETQNSKGAVILFEDCNLKNTPDEFIDLLKATFKKDGSHVYFTEEKMTWWLDKDVSGHPASYCNAFFVLKQADPSETTYCASLSGATKKIEQSKNYAPLASVYRLPPYSLVTLFFGNRLVGSGYSEKEVDTYNVEEQEISSLKGNESEVILFSDSGIYNCKVVL